MGELARRYPHLDIWGGCCGTWDTHLTEIAGHLCHGCNRPLIHVDRDGWTTPHFGRDTPVTADAAGCRVQNYFTASVSVRHNL
ncbi:MAG: hypothetical protein EXQ79_04640 [Acidimicrobiia bacterium]|nr:hypothetical protein [Acidimicrobiia bacterium]